MHCTAHCGTKLEGRCDDFLFADIVLFCGTSPIDSDRKRGNDLATVFDFGTLLCLN
jgi:hypothetical protein